MTVCIAFGDASVAHAPGDWLCQRPAAYSATFDLTPLGVNHRVTVDWCAEHTAKFRASPEHIKYVVEIRSIRPVRGEP